jgi:L-arabinose isomerase
MMNTHITTAELTSLPATNSPDESPDVDLLQPTSIKKNGAKKDTVFSFQLKLRQSIKQAQVSGIKVVVVVGLQ